MRAFCAAVLLSLFLMPTVQAAEEVLVPTVPVGLLQAAKGGDAEAQLEIGILFEYGFFMKGNLPYALAWYTLAAERGNAKAAGYRDKLLQKLTPEEIDRADTLAKGFGVAPAPAAVPKMEDKKPEPTAPASPAAPAG